MVAQRAVGKQRRRLFVEGRYGNPAGHSADSGSHKGVVIFTSICIVILLAFYAYFAWYLLTSL